MLQLLCNLGVSLGVKLHKQGNNIGLKKIFFNFQALKYFIFIHVYCIFKICV